MAATFRTRPWQLAAFARPAFAPALSNSTATSLLAHSQQMRLLATKSRRLPPAFRASIKRTRKDQETQDATATLSRGMVKDSQASSNVTETAVLAPRTLVPQPFRKTCQLRVPQMLRYWKEIILQRILDRAGIFQQTWRLKTSAFSRAKFRAPRKGVAEAAIKLHAEMSRCLAAGGATEKAQLAKICVPKLHRSLVAAIESRPAGRTYKWECLSLKRNSLRWPRLVDHKWVDVDVGFMQSFRQATVGIRSKQRLTELDAKGNVVATKEMEVSEYVVLWKSVDKENLTQGDWFIYGTLKEMSLDQITMEKEAMQGLGDLIAAEKVRDRSKLASK